MARQKTKLSDKFADGGSEVDSKEASLFADTELQATPEFKAMHMLKEQLDEITDVINANDAASGSYADLKKEYVASSGSFSTRVATNDAKTVLVVGTGSGNAKAGNTTTITSGQTNAITANTLKVGTETDLSITREMEVKMTVTGPTDRGAYALVFTMKHGKNTKTATIDLS